MRSSLAAGEDVASLGAAHRRQQQLQDRRHRRRRTETSPPTPTPTPKTPVATHQSIPIPPVSSGRRRRPRPSDSRTPEVDSANVHSTPGDELLSSLQALEDDAADDLSTGSSLSEIWKATAPFVAPQEEERDQPAVATPARALTPTGPLMDKLESLTRTWTVIQENNTPTSSVTRSIRSKSQSLRKQQQQQPQHTRIPTSSSTPRRPRTTTTNIGHQITSSSPVTRRQRQINHQHSQQQEDNDQESSVSVGDSTITSTSSADESVFDRLYRMGRESEEKKQQRRARNLQKEREQLQQERLRLPTSPSTTTTTTTPSRRRLSYTPKMLHTSPSKSKPRGGLSSRFTTGMTTPRPTKNRISAYTESHSVASRSHTKASNSRRTTATLSSSSSASKIPRIVSSSSKTTPRTTRTARENDGDGDEDRSVSSSTTTESSVFERLHRNEKRTDRLWSPPGAFTPTKSTKKPTTPLKQPRLGRNKGLLIDTALGDVSSKMMDRKTPKKSGNSTRMGGPTTTLPPASSADSIHDAFDMLEELLADDDSPHTTTTTAFLTDDETTTRTTTLHGVTAGGSIRSTREEEQPDQVVTKTPFSLDPQRNPYARLQSQPSLELVEAPTATTMTTTGTDTVVNEDEEDTTELLLSASIGQEESDIIPLPNPLPETTLDEDLAEIDDIGKELLLGSQDENDNDVAEDETMYSSEEPEDLETALEDDLEEIQEIGRDLMLSSSSRKAGEELSRHSALGLASPSRSRSRSRSSCLPTTPTTLEEDMAEIEEIGKELRSQGEGSRHSRISTITRSPSVKSGSTSSRVAASKTPSVVFLQYGDDDEDDEEIDLLEGIEDGLLALENPPTASPEFATAPTPRRRTTKPSTEGQDYFFSTDHESPQRSEGKRSLTIKPSASPPSIPPAASSSSKDSSGFFSLDEKSGGLVMDAFYTNHVVPLQRQAKTLQLDNIVQPGVTTPRHVLVAAAVRIQSTWRRYQAEYELASRLVVSCQVDWSSSDRGMDRTLARKALELVLRNLNDPYIDQGMKMDQADIFVSWETSVPDTGTMSIVVEASTVLVLHQWGSRMIARRLLQAALLGKAQEKEAEGELQQMVVPISEDALLSSAVDSANEDELADTERSLTSCSTNGMPTDMDLALFKQHRAAVRIQNWFRLRMLKAALHTSTDSQEQLQQALDTISNSSSAMSSKGQLSSQQDNLVNARRILHESFSLENILDPYDSSGSTPAPWSLSGGAPSQEWIERRAATLAIHNIVQAYLRGLQRYRQSRKAVAIQAYWRRFDSQRFFQRKRLATLYIQFQWRCYIFRKEQVLAAAHIQSEWRRTLARRNWEVVRFSVVSLQAVWRKALARSHLHAVRIVARSIQNSFRSRPDRARFLRLQSAVTTLQGSHRLRAVKSNFRREWINSTTIQKEWRMNRASRLWRETKQSIICVQREWRRKSAQIHLHQQRNAAIEIQCIFRGHAVQQQKLRSAFAAVQLQAQWRRYDQICSFRHERSQAVAIQCFFRQITAQRELRRLREILIRATIQLQCLIRSHLAQTQLEYARAAAIMIQANWKGYRQRAVLFQQYSAIIQLQRLARGVFARERAQVAIHAAIRIQSLSRHSAIRRQVMLWRVSATKIQSAWRAAETRVSYMELRSTAMMIQASYRGHVQRKHFRRQIDVAVRLQCLARAKLAKMYLSGLRAANEKTREIKAALTIQTRWRTSHALAEYETARGACIILQSVVRMGIAVGRGRSERHRLDELQSAIILQKYCRGMMAKMYLSGLRAANEKTREIKAALTIQTRWRTSHALAEYETARGACIILQSVFRMCMVGRRYQAVRHRHDELQSAIVLQKSCRGMIIRSRLLAFRSKAATDIQKVWRRAVSMSSFKNTREACITLQSMIRSHLAISRYHSKIRSTIAIQTEFRACRAREHFTYAKAAVIMIQALGRGFLIRMDDRRTTLAGLTIQRNWRGHYCRQELHQRRELRRLYQEAKRTKSARRIQRAWRRRSFHQAFTRRKMKLLYESALQTTATRKIQRKFRCRQERMRNTSAINIQKYLRGFILRINFAQEGTSAAVIQAVVRGYQGRELAEAKFKYIKGIVLIQTSWRAALARDSFVRNRASAAMIQALIRGYFVRHLQEMQHSAAVEIQKMWRGSQQKDRFIRRKQMIQLYQSARQHKYARKIQRTIVPWLAYQRQKRILASVLQSQWRSVQQRAQFTKTRSCIVLLQSFARRTNERKRYHDALEAAIVIQSFVRMGITRAKFKETADAILLIQTEWRRAIALKTFVKARSSTITIQTRVRRYLARAHSNRTRQASALLIQTKFKETADAILLIQTEWRRAIALKTFVKARSSTTTIQTRVRRYLARAHSNRTRQASALLIQTKWRRATALEAFSRARCSALAIQGTFRGHLARGQVSTLVLQDDDMRERAAARIHIVFRGHVDRERYLQTRSSAIRLQAWYRMLRVRSTYWFFLEPREVRYTLDAAARRIQLAYVLWKMRLAVLEMESSAVILRRCMRGQLVRSAARFALTHMNASIRSAPLSPVARVSSPTNSTALSTLTAWHRAVGYAKITAAIVIQAAARRMLVRARLQSELGVAFEASMLDLSVVNSETYAAIDIQRAFRDWRQGRQMAANYLQRLARQVIARKKYHALRLAVARMKQDMDTPRESTTLDRTIVESEAATKIVVRSQISAVVAIQRMYRGHNCRRKCMAILWRNRRLLHSDLRKRQVLAAAIIQRYCRGWLGRQQRVTYVHRRPDDTSMNDSSPDDDIIRRHVARLEAASIETATRHGDAKLGDMFGPCVGRLAMQTRVRVDSSRAMDQDTLPKFVEDTRLLAIEVEKTTKATISSPRGDGDTGFKCPEPATSTPVRSNKAPPVPNDKPAHDEQPKAPTLKPVAATTATTARDLATEARMLLLQGRETLRREKQTVQVPAAAAPPPPPRPESPDEINSTTSSRNESECSERKVSSPVPGESFFEGESKEIPSPIKGSGTEEWNWADEW